MKSRLVIGTKSSWWNRPLTGKWMIGIWIGYGISALIASYTIRWLAILMIALFLIGCLFALVMRLSRKDREI